MRMAPEEVVVVSAADDKCIRGQPISPLTDSLVQLRQVVHLAQIELTDRQPVPSHVVMRVAEARRKSGSLDVYYAIGAHTRDVVDGHDLTGQDRELPGAGATRVHREDVGISHDQVNVHHESFGVSR